MSHAFISYSRQDSKVAFQVAAELRAHGVEVWIDQHSLEAASQWTKEIVGAIKACSVFVILLSKHSLASPNVIREVLIASERGKAIVPIELEQIELTEEFEYPLAGIQRVALSSTEAIHRAIERARLKSQAAAASGTDSHGHAPSGHTHAGHSLHKASAGGQISETRPSLMILPFEDHSPQVENNAWFADGLTGELISALSNVKDLRVIDRKTAMDFKAYHGTPVDIALELDIRYFILGSVQKYQDQIKISAQLLDVTTSEHLWQHTYKGEFKDIFDIQESVASKVVEALKVKLSDDERRRVNERGTESTEAYQYLLAGNKLFELHSREHLERAVHLYSEAIELDPKYAQAYKSKGNAICAICRTYGLDKERIREARGLLEQALVLAPTFLSVYNPLSLCYYLEGKTAEAEEIALRFVEQDPENAESHFALGAIYMEQSAFSKAIGPFERALSFAPDSRAILWNLLICCAQAGETERCATWAAVALKVFQKHVRLHPQDELVHVTIAVTYHWLGRNDESREYARGLAHLRDGNALYNLASLQLKINEHRDAIHTLRRAVDAGFRRPTLLRDFLEDEDSGIIAFKDDPAYQELKLIIERAISAESV